jgi:hypothetical protein
MDALQGAEFAVLDSGYDIWIRAFAEWVKPFRFFFFTFVLHLSAMVAQK